MKIVCEACQAKYSISDEKVRGKAFKIRCKKCGHIIVVRSGEGSSSAALPVQTDAPGSPAPTPSVVSAENSWHIVVEGEQVGPLSASDVRARLSRGEITGETFIWREGLADWLKVSSVPEFSDAGGGDDDGGTPFPSQPPTTIYPPGTAESAFAASPGSGEQDVFAAPTMISSTASADLFASPVSAAPEPAASPSFSFGAAAPLENNNSRHTHGGNGSSAGGALTGQRHENSVLFSLSNLEALASPASAPPSMAPRPGAAGGATEGSGLIDIRSMAAMTLGAQSDNRHSSDLPTFGAPQFSPVAPVLLPIGQSSGPPKWMLVLIGAGLLVALAIGGAAYVILQRPTVATAPAPAAVAPAPAPVPAPAAAHPAAQANPTTPPSTPPAPANEVLPPRDTKPAVAEKAGKGGKAAKGGKKGSHAEVASTGSSSAPPVTAPPKADPPSTRPNVGSRDKLDELLDGAIGGQKKPAASRPRDDDDSRKPAAASASLPALEKSDIVKAMMAVNPKVHDCFNQFKVPGVAMVTLKLARGGRVNDANVSGKFAGTPTGACVESAAKGAKFPPTEAQTIAYPFPLH
jgi:predicted Zn finger-like uncharacterized protein